MRRVLFLTSALLLLAAAPAAAQSPPPSVPPQCPTAQFLGNYTEGDRFGAEGCGFAPGTPVSKALNGQSAGTETADSDGFVEVIIVVNSDGVALSTPAFAVVGLEFAQDGAPTVTVDGQTLRARLGANSLVMSGANADGGTRTVRFTFNILPEGASGGGSGTISGSPAPSGGGSLVRTGGAILRWSFAAFALIALGGIFVFVDRRRRKAAEV